MAVTDICLLLTALNDITDVLSLFKPMESAVLKQCYKCYNGTRHAMTTPIGIATEKRDIKENQKGQIFMLVASSTVIEDSCVWLFVFLKGATTNLSIQKC